MRWMRTVGRLLWGLFIGGVASCTPTVSGGVCDGVPWSCMDLTVTNTGAYSKVEVTLGKLYPSLPQVLTSGNIPSTPYHLRIAPPIGTSTSSISWLDVRGRNSANMVEHARIDGISWPDGAHISYSLSLQLDSNSVLPFSSFAKHFTFSATASAIVADDFNKDGKTDIAAAIWADNTVNLLMGDGIGGFSSKDIYPVDKGPNDIASGDLDGDSYLDLATANFAGQSISTLINLKNGKFKPPVAIVSQNYPAYLVLSDLNEDGKLDLFHQLTGTAGSWAEYRWGDGRGGFGGPAGTVPTLGCNQGPVYSADMNGDGKKDIITGTTTKCNTLFLMMYNGAGGFPRTDMIRVPQVSSSRPQSLSIIDLNNDKLADIAAVNLDADDGVNALEILINNGNGLTYTSKRYNVGLKPVRIAAADIDLDGTAELLVTNFGDDSVSIFYLDLLGSVSRTKKFTVGGQPTCVATADVNQDKRPDLIVCSGNGIDVFLNTTL